MALLKFKRSAVPAKIPSIADLDLGELAINTYDGKVYTKKDDGTEAIVEVGGGGGVQTIASADGSVTVTGTTDIDLSVAVAAATTTIILPVRNNTGATLAKGTAVYINGALGQNPTVTKAIATGDATSAQTLGLMTANLSNNSVGNVTLIGTLTNIDTSAYSDGQQLYLSPTTAGALTATKPYAPNHLVYMAVVEHAHPSLGKLFVKVQNGYEMDELHDVSAQNPANNDGLFYNTTSGLWEKKSIVTALGYTPANRAGDTFTGVVSIYNSNDAQLYLNGNGTSWAGMSWADVSGSDYIWYNGSTSTFAIGSGGSFVANKKLHVHGGMTIGSGLAMSASGTNSLLVEETITANQVYAQIFYDSQNGAYYVDPAASSNLYSATVNSVLVLPAAAGTNSFFVGTGDGASLSTYNFGLSGWNGMAFYNPTVGGAFPNATTGFLAFRDGFIEMRGSLRAPVFYDSDNTGYYVDAAGTSVLGGIVVNSTLDVRDSNAQFWRSTNGAYQRVDTRTEATSLSRAHWYGVNSSGGTSNFRHAWYDNAAYFNVTAQDGEIIFERTAGETIVRSTGSFRAPIFYDSNNTGFYVDPNATSNLSRLNVAGRSMAGSATLDMSGLDQNTWYPVTIPIASARQTRLRIENALNSNAPSWSTHPSGFSCYVEWTSNGAGWGTIGVNRRVVDWRESFTSVQIVGGIDQLTQSSTEVIWLRGGGNYFFSADNDVNPTIRTSTYEINGQTVSPRTTTYNTPWTASTGQTGAAILYATSTITSATDVRAPIFYDSNDTSYYVDANSTSVLNGINVWGEIGSRRNDVQSLLRSYNLSAGSPLQFYLDHNYGNVNIGNSRGVVYAGGSYWEIANSVRAPLFYDTDNTGYYLDPASTGLSLYTAGEIRTIGQITNGNYLVGGLQSGALNIGRIDLNYRWEGTNWGATSTLGILANCSDYWEMGVHDSGARVTSALYYDGINNRFIMGRDIGWGPTFVVAASSFRAPIFYDNDNTGYYLDPNSTGTSLNVAGNLDCIARSAAWSEGLRVRVPTRATWGGVRFTRDEGNANGNWGIGYTGIDSTDDFTFWGCLNGAEGMRARLTQTGNFSIAGSFTAAAASTTGSYSYFSNHGGGNVGNYSSYRYQLVWAIGDSYKGTLDGTSVAGGYGLWFSHPNAGGVASNLSTHGLMLIQNGVFQASLDPSMRAIGDMRAPIFYDYSDTGWYVDPNGTSNLYQITGAVTHGSYGSLSVSGSLNGYAGIAFPAVAATLMMNQGASGFYFNNNTWGMYCNNTGGVLAQVYYDISNTGYYLDPHSTGTSLNVAGSIIAAGNVTAYSDIRIKANVETIPSALDKLDQIRGVTYTRTDLDNKEQRYAGVIAQEIEAVLPEAVRDLGNIKAVDYNATIALLIQAVKELRDEVEALRK